MTVAERINKFITEIRPEAVCDGCIAVELKLRPQQVNQVTLALGTTSDFDRDLGDCSMCGGVGHGGKVYHRLDRPVEKTTRRI